MKKAMVQESGTGGGADEEVRSVTCDLPAAP